jgi:hypothetical protein
LWFPTLNAKGAFRMGHPRFTGGMSRGELDGMESGGLGVS